MATLHDTALGSNDASGTSLATSDALAVSAGDLIFVVAKWEGASGSTASVTDGTNSYSTANAQLQHVSNADMQMQTFYAIAASAGTINPTVGLTSARPFRKILAYSVTPAGGQQFTTVGNVAAAQGNGNPSSGAASATAAGFAGVGVTFYATDSLTAGSGWSIPAEFAASSALKSEYQLQSGAGSLTGDGTSGINGDWIAQLAIFEESASGGGGGGGAPLMGQACL